MPETRSREPLVWIDCEMTGLDLDKDTIMSLACFITDYELNLLDETGYEAVIEHSREQMDAMGDWCRDHHGASGLTKACIESTTTADTAAISARPQTRIVGRQYSTCGQGFLDTGALDESDEASASSNIRCQCYKGGREEVGTD
ncbi:Phosphatidylinositol 3,4,5-trisphosphate-dependent Rac exchanger 2 protein [Recurvomyces mirabilis]|uniref:Phosphatidylinositol 3,4,5-trisphosphate-dependent Rac exchanger 2 protein n=1 Tax=Recurvomyces mirabilis TaxID=574656 RepID=A0AAE1BYV4_9PEZI|nr:Phosphatidylinositol 3,4,5-trisphosphate-dependent Rac exchanger 2 protein [Recurvomyces mirabilis]KAK5150940.1 Phosphatidylinositol 3,4,5-trisphosphate-dependent Rac exchanger 2 protein [Recurvomyces mirabilis]